MRWLKRCEYKGAAVEGLAWQSYFDESFFRRKAARRDDDGCNGTKRLDGYR